MPRASRHSGHTTDPGTLFPLQLQAVRRRPEGARRKPHEADTEYVCLSDRDRLDRIESAADPSKANVALSSPLSLSGDVAYVPGTMTPRPELGITEEDLAETPPLRVRMRARVDDGRWFGELEGIANAGQTHVDESLGEAATRASEIANVSAGVRLDG